VADPHPGAVPLLHRLQLSRQLLALHRLVTRCCRLLLKHFNVKDWIVPLSLFLCNLRICDYGQIWIVNFSLPVNTTLERVTKMF